MASKAKGFNAYREDIAKRKEIVVPSRKDIVCEARYGQDKASFKRGWDKKGYLCPEPEKKYD